MLNHPRLLYLVIAFAFFASSGFAKTHIEVIKVTQSGVRLYGYQESIESYCQEDRATVCDLTYPKSLLTMDVENPQPIAIEYICTNHTNNTYKDSTIYLFPGTVARLSCDHVNGTDTRKTCSKSGLVTGMATVTALATLTIALANFFQGTFFGNQS